MSGAPNRPLRLLPDRRLPAGSILDEPRLRRILDLLGRDGEETRVVGGAVRNALLGTRPGDLDLATTALPETVVARARAAGFRTIPTGLAHGTVTVMVAGQPFEVTTLREDVDTDGRHATVRFGRDFEADARRRDFTINALSVGLDGLVRDTVDGIADLAGGRVRFIGDAGTRIREDFLRVLRFFRFHATYGIGPLDAEGLAACAREQGGIARLSRERVRAELLKLLAAPGATDVLRAMDAAGILTAVLGTGCEPERVARIAALERPDPDPLLRLAALALRSPEDVNRLRAALRLSNAEQARCSAMLAAKSAFPPGLGPPGEAEIRAALFDHGRSATSDALALCRADIERVANDASWAGAARAVAQTPEPVLPWTGADLLARGLKGPAVGAALARLRRAWADADFPRDGAVLAAFLDDAAPARATP